MEIQELYNRILEKRKKRKELNNMIRDAYVNDPKYREKKENMLAIRQSLKQLELSLKTDYEKEVEQLEALDDDIKTDIDMLSDLALNKILENKEVELKDEYDNVYTPELKVSFKKK